jgi:hypothetical protein
MGAATLSLASLSALSTMSDRITGAVPLSMERNASCFSLTLPSLGGPAGWTGMTRLAVIGVTLSGRLDRAETEHELDQRPDERHPLDKGLADSFLYFDTGNASGSRLLMKSCWVAAAT